MNRIGRLTLALVALALGAWIADLARANGGPFVLKYPKGDPAAKGVLARLDDNLKPRRETTLRVVKEDLTVTFAPALPGVDTPLVHVAAAYTIENPTDREIEIDFGFPILRGLYISPWSMMIEPAVRVQMNGTRLPHTLISNSDIYAIIRQRAGTAIDAAVAADKPLSARVQAVRNADQSQRENARADLAAHLTDSLKWNSRDAALMKEYASLDFGQPKAHPRDRALFSSSVLRDPNVNLLNENLGALAAIGEQKATQFFAQLVSRFDPEAAASYENIFTAWGGDVRERSVDLTNGKVRPREITVDPDLLESARSYETRGADPTIYARVDYLDADAKITEAERDSCRTVLKNLPVVFTFAPMNLLHYRVTFPANAAQTLAVTYSQYAYGDTRAPASYQLAYVVHPASLWDDFGPINLEVASPEGVPFAASVPCQAHPAEKRKLDGPGMGDKEQRFAIYRATLTDKTGELFLAIDADAWKRAVIKKQLTAVTEQSAKR